MVLPDEHHIVRTCKGSSVDAPTGRPTPASFDFRRTPEGAWKDDYLSVNWLEHLECPAPAPDLPARIAVLRAFLHANHPFPVLKPTATSLLAAIPVSKVHAAANLPDGPATLQCRHEPGGDGDPHSGVHPDPGVHVWPAEKDAAAHLAVKQFLFQAVCHVEKGALPA